jgi:ferritin
MSAWAESANLKGFANWFRVQSLEEMVHVMKFFQYVLDRDGQVKLTPIGGPATQWDSPLAAFEAALAHERLITGRINNLAGLAIKENDHATHTLLEWFLNEQVEEEATAKLIVEQLKLAGDAPAALFMLDRELGARTLASAAAGT